MMIPEISILQEKDENVANIRASLPECAFVRVRTIEEAIPLLEHRYFDLIISAVHLEYDGSVFDFLKFAKGNPRSSSVPFVFYCCQSSTFARSVRDGLQIAARALGADKYITMEHYDRDKLRDEFKEYLPLSELVPFRQAQERSNSWRLQERRA